MDPRRLSAGEWIAAAGGVLLVVSLFLPWYTAGGHHVNAWRSMAVDDVLFAIAGGGAVVAVIATSLRRRQAVPVAYMTLATVGGLITTILVVWRLVDPAPSADVGLGVGAWLGLVGVLTVAGGSWAGMSDEGPARRSERAARAAAEAARQRTELVSLPPDMGAEA